MGIVSILVEKVAAAKQKAVDKKVILAMLTTAVSDGKIDTSEMAEIQGKYADLGLSLIDIQGIRATVYARALDAAMTDGVVTRDEEAELQKIQDFLKIPDSEIGKSKKALAQYRLLSEIQMGNLPIIDAPKVLLQRNEVPHWMEAASLLEVTVVAKRFIGASSGLSIRIAKGLTYRVGQSRGQLLTDKEVRAVSDGVLVITNNRLIFQGDRKSFQIRLDKLLNAQLHTDGISVTGESGTPKVLKFSKTGNRDIFGSVLSLAINNYRP